MDNLSIPVLLISLMLITVRTETIMRICQIDFNHLARPETVSCPTGQLMAIENALWGRAHPAVTDDTNESLPDRYCPGMGSGDDQTLCPGDPEDALVRVRELCQDKESCQLRPTAVAFGNICPDVYKYLEFTYSCVLPGSDDDISNYLDCDCTLNGTSLQVKVFDEPDLKLYSSGQKTVLSAYKNDQHDSCKFKFQAVSLGSTAPAQLSAMTFNIGKHTKNRNKFYRSYKMFGPRVLERGVNKKKEKQVTLPYCWTSPDQQTDICIERVGDVIQFRSTTCPYALDVDVGTTPMTGTLFVEKSYSDQLTGMCGNCDNQDNGYHLADGTSVDDEEDMQERYRLITESYLDTKARSRRSRN